MYILNSRGVLKSRQTSYVALLYFWTIFCRFSPAHFITPLESVWLDVNNCKMVFWVNGICVVGVFAKCGEPHIHFPLLVSSTLTQTYRYKGTDIEKYSRQNDIPVNPLQGSFIGTYLDASWWALLRLPSLRICTYPDEYIYIYNLYMNTDSDTL